MPILIAILWALTAAGAAGYATTIMAQVTYVTLADGRRQLRAVPFLIRMVLPLAPNISPCFNNRRFDRLKTGIERQLTAAGMEGLFRPEDLLSLRILLPLTVGSVWMILIAGFFHMRPDSVLVHADWLVYLLVPFWMFLYPGLWLQHAMQFRHRSIRRALPFVLDLLTLSVEAGMDFMSALQRLVERGSVDALGEELIRVVREIQLGKTRRQALRDMGNRVQLGDLRSVVSALVQADELGVSIGSILRIQSDQIRQRRFARAEQLAHEAPVKMLAPLLIFIFPAVFLILLGPIIGRMLQQGF